MESRVKVLGHSVHPMLIVFPLGLLATAMVFDLIYVFNENSIMAWVAYWMIVSGLIGGAIAGAAGWLDWLAIPAATRAKSVGLIHGLINSFILVLAAANVFLRNDDPATPPTIAVVLSVVIVLLALVGGWLGGELVERLGVAVHDGANLNAPNSLVEDKADATKKPVQSV